MEATHMPSFLQYRRWIAVALLGLSTSCGVLLTASLLSRVPIFELGDLYVGMERGRTILLYNQIHEMFATDRQQKVRWSYDSTSFAHFVRLRGFSEYKDRYGRDYPAFVSLALELSALPGIGLILIGLVFGVKYGRKWEEQKEGRAERRHH